MSSHAEVEPAKFERAAVRWLARYLSESPRSLLDAQVAAAGLAQLPNSDEAKVLLRDLASR